VKISVTSMENLDPGKLNSRRSSQSFCRSRDASKHNVVNQINTRSKRKKNTGKTLPSRKLQVEKSRTNSRVVGDELFEKVESSNSSKSSKDVNIDLELKEIEDSETLSTLRRACTQLKNSLKCALRTVDVSECKSIIHQESRDFTRAPCLQGEGINHDAFVKFANVTGTHQSDPRFTGDELARLVIEILKHKAESCSPGEKEVLTSAIHILLCVEGENCCQRSLHGERVKKRRRMDSGTYFQGNEDYGTKRVKPSFINVPIVDNGEESKFDLDEMRKQVALKGLETPEDFEIENTDFNLGEETDFPAIVDLYPSIIDESWSEKDGSCNDEIIQVDGGDSPSSLVSSPQDLDRIFYLLSPLIQEAMSPPINSPMGTSSTDSLQYESNENFQLSEGKGWNLKKISLVAPPSPPKKLGIDRRGMKFFHGRPLIMTDVKFLPSIPLALNPALCDPRTLNPKNR